MTDELFASYKLVGEMKKADPLLVTPSANSWPKVCSVSWPVV